MMQFFPDLEKEVNEGDTSDEDYRTTRDRVRGCNKKLNELAQQLQREVVEGRLGAHKKGGTSRSEQEGSPSYNIY